MSVKVIIADDHTIVRDGLKLILENSGNIKVIDEAEDGLQAIAKVRDLKPDVVLMDISMKNMNGIEATKRIKEEHPEIQIVILSIQSSSEDIYRALKAGAIGYLLKESAGAEVVEAVISVSQGRRYLSRKVDDTLIDSYISENKKSNAKSLLDLLSSREREVLQLVTEGKSSAEISKMLFISVKTVETYRSRLMQKLGIKDITELVRFAIQHGII